MLQVQQLTKNYGKKRVLKSIDLTVQQGEIFGFLGRNGAGKSTFINILTGLAKQTSGTVTFFNGQTLTNDVKKKIGVLPDYSMFYPHLTALEHLRYFSAVSGEKVSKAHAKDMLARVGLVKDIHTKVSKFSFGMKKKLGFAQAIIHDPQLIFLDEPTSGVDAESAIVLQTLMRDLQHRGKTIFLTSHNLAEIEKLCDRIAILKDGVITKIGTIDELKTNDTDALYVQIKHGKVPEDCIVQLSKYTEIVKHTEQFTTLHIRDEKQNAEILKILHAHHVDVYRVEMSEKTLEEIFIDEERKRA